MFKKIASILLAAMMASTAVVAVSAAETEEAVAAADDSAVAAADDSAVAAADDSAVAAADDSGAAGAGNKVYFKTDTSIWKTAKTIYIYIGEHGGDSKFAWGSKKGAMEDEGDNIWSFDLDKVGFDSSKQYTFNFTADWNAQTCDMLFDSGIMGKTCVLTADKVENNVDSNKSSYVCYWDGADTSKYGPVKLITSIGNIIGSVYWADSSPYKMLVNFISSDGGDGLANAMKYNGKTAQQTLDDVAKELGLGQDDIENAIKESGKTVDWKKESSAAQSGSTDNSSSSNNNSSSNSSSSNSSSSSSTSKTTSTGTGSVSSGQGETLVFLFSGIMLAAAGIVFLARKRRED